MYAVLIFLTAIAPAFLFGWFLPSVFTLFESDIKAPLNKRTWVLTVLLLPWLVASGWWMLFLLGYEEGRFGYVVWRAMLLATFIASMTTSLRLRVLPRVIKTLRDWFERLDVWMYSHTP